MIDPINREDEVFIGKARIYHRYRILGLDRPGGERNLRAVQQVLPFVTAEEEQSIVDQLTSRNENQLDSAMRQERIRTAAAQESASLESSLKFVNSTRYEHFDEYVARHEELAKLVVRLFHTDISNPKQV